MLSNRPTGIEIQSLKTQLPYIVRGYGPNLHTILKTHGLYNHEDLVIAEHIDDDTTEPLVYLTIGNCYFNEVDAHIIERVSYVQDNFCVTGKKLTDYQA